MCNPAALLGVSLAISGAQGVAGYMGQMQSYQAQQEMFKQNFENAREATFRQWDATNLRITQEGAAATQQKFETALETRRAAATAEVAAGEGGVSGGSVDAVLGDIYARGGRATDAVDTNLQMTRSYLDASMDSQRAQGQNQINSVPRPQQPSFVPVLLNVFGSGLNAYTNYRQSI